MFELIFTILIVIFSAFFNDRKTVLEFVLLLKIMIQLSAISFSFFNAFGQVPEK